MVGVVRKRKYILGVQSLALHGENFPGVVTDTPTLPAIGDIGALKERR